MGAKVGGGPIMGLCLSLLALLLLLPATLAADPTLTNETVTGGGNSADRDSKITWAPVTSGAPYKASAPEPDSSMKPFYNFARSFASATFSDLPLEAIAEVMSGKRNFMDDWQVFVTPMAGYAACVAVGLLFIIIFPIVGCCLCCCRCCCNNCGGKMVQERSGSTACKRHVFGIIMLIIVAFIAVGMACSYVNNERMTSTFSGMNTLIKDNMDDVATFLNNTVVQMEEVKGDKVDFLLRVLYRDLDSIGYLLGIPIREAIKTDTGLNTAIQSVNNLVADMDTTFSAMGNVVTKFNGLVTAAEILKYNLSVVKSQIEDASSSIDTSALNADFDPSQLPNITGEFDKLESVRNANYTALLAEASAQIDDIPQRVENESAQGIADIKNEVDSFKSKLDGPVDQIKNLTSAIDIKQYTKNFDIEGYLEEAQSYDKYRWYAGVALTCTILLVVLLQFLGLAFGVCGSSASDLPTERGCLSTSGGNMLVASVVFIFIFSSLLMLLTTLTFMLGAPMEEYMCLSLRDPDLKFLGKALHTFGVTQSEALEFTLNVNGENLTLNAPEILKSCRNHSALLGVVDVSSVFNLSVLTNYKSQLNIDDQLDSFAPNFSSVSILPADLETRLNDFKTAVNVNFTAFYAELSKNATAGSLDGVIAELNQTIATGTLPPANQSKLEGARDNLMAIQANELPNVLTAKTELNTSVAVLEAKVTPIPGKIDTVLSNFNSTQEYLNRNGTELAKKLVRAYADRLFGILDSFVAFIQNALFHDVGTCTPISNLVDTLFVGGICGLVVDPLNGFWCALGWCLFFYVFAVIFALKLSKHYRCMKELHPNDPEYDKGGPTLPYVEPPPFASNKVGHHDKY